MKLRSLAENNVLGEQNGYVARLYKDGKRIMKRTA